VARAEVLDAIDAGDSAARLHLAHALLEQALAAARANQRRLNPSRYSPLTTSS
jgi:hydroxyethylthiazole kinase-like sugar kinase family protein